MPSHRHSANSGRVYEPIDTSAHDMIRDLQKSLSQMTADRDRFAAQYERSLATIKDQDRQLRKAEDATRSLSAEATQHEKELSEYKFQLHTSRTEHTQLQAAYESLRLKYDAINVPDKSNPLSSAAIPDRTKRATTSSGSTSSGSSAGASRSQPDSRRARSRDRERERERRREKEMEMVIKADNERLSNRFEHKPVSSGSRRLSFVGTSQRSSTATLPSSRGSDRASRADTYEAPLVSPREAGGVSSVPRTVPQATDQYHSNRANYGYDDRDDGNYRTHPVR